MAKSFKIVEQGTKDTVGVSLYLDNETENVIVRVGDRDIIELAFDEDEVVYGEALFLDANDVVAVADDGMFEINR
jgi:hypothetical protein